MDGTGTPIADPGLRIPAGEQPIGICNPESAIGNLRPNRSEGIVMVRMTALALLGALVGAQDTFKVDDEGFIRNWLVLAPIACENENNGAEEIDKAQLKDEGKVTPKEGEKATIGGKELAWTKHQTPDYYIDFREYVKDGQFEQVIGYAVAYVIAEDDIKDVKVQMGSNDQGKVFLNGVEVVKFSETRTLDKDQDASEAVTLKKGRNAVVLKVINEQNNWQGCVRFTNKDGAPIKNLKVSLAPQ